MANTLFYMKKILLATVTFMSFVFVNAQSIKEEITLSHERVERLQRLCDGYQPCGNSNIDGYGDAIKDAAIYSIANSLQLENFYKRQVGEPVDGVQDVTVTKPTLEDWNNLSLTIAGEGTKIKEATDKAKSAGVEASKIAQGVASEKNPMKAAKAAKASKTAAAVVQFGSDATPILLEESAAQLKAIGEIIKTLQSGDNL